MNIIFATDNNYAIGLSITIASMLEHLSGISEVRLFIIDGGINSDNKARFARLMKRSKVRTSLKFISADLSALDNLPINQKHFSAANYIRLLIPTIVDQDIEKIIYLDSDLLIRANLKELWDIDIEDYALLAVREYNSPTKPETANHSIPKALQLNSGVLVMNLNRWRQENLSGKIFHYIHQNADSNLFADQDGINAVLASDWKEIDLRWNVPVYIFRNSLFSLVQSSKFKEFLDSYRSKLKHEGFIFHYLGAAKPWKIGCGLVGQLECIHVLEQNGWYHQSELAKAFSRSCLLRTDYYYRQIFRAAKSLVGKT